MKRVCCKDHPDPMPDRCRLCWLYVNDPNYRCVFCHLCQKAHLIGEHDGDVNQGENRHDLPGMLAK